MKTPTDAARDRLIAQVRNARGNLRNVTGPGFFLDDLALLLGFDSLADLIGPDPLPAAYRRPERTIDSGGRVTVSVPPPLELFEAEDSGPCPHLRVEMTYPNNRFWTTCLDCGDVISVITGKERD